jgi:Coenzyme PQQ synthesis protein D (PqqD)
MKIQLGDDVVWRDLVDDVVILDLATGTYFGLEGVGNDMWRLIAKHGSSDKVLEVLRDEYDVEPDTLERDFQGLVEELAARGLVKIERDGDGSSDSDGET